MNDPHRREYKTSFRSLHGRSGGDTRTPCLGRVSPKRGLQGTKDVVMRETKGQPSHSCAVL
eukprot:8477025-Prorocentrum_lima.AAC.1